jgi:L-lactate dehydrogenase complex protein LldF
MRIPLPKMMRHWREREFEKHLSPASMRWGLGVWGFFARRPALYRLVTAAAAHMLRSMAGRRGKLATVPFAGGWTKFRDLPAPQGKTFQQMLRAKRSQDHV